MGAAAAHTLRKSERLCGKKDISALFSEGKWGVGAHIRYCWAGGRDGQPNRILVSVPKKFFKRAVKRNLLKRRMREAYRTQKELLNCSGVDFLLSWTSKEIGDWETVREEVAAALARIDKSVAKQQIAASRQACEDTAARKSGSGQPAAPAETDPAE